MKRVLRFLAAGAVSLAFVPAAEARPLPAPPATEDCGCDPPAPALRAGMPGAPTLLPEPRRNPATLTLERDGERLRVEADVIEGLLDDGPIEARGEVVAKADGIVLQADLLSYDRVSGKGLASGSVQLSMPPYRLVAESLAFDAEARTAEARNWRAWVDGEVQAHGRLLAISASSSVAYDASVSPCLAEDPGYRFDFSRVEWTPRAGGGTVSGKHAFVKLSGVPVFWLPYFRANLPAPKLPWTFENPEINSQVQAGYDAFDGFYASSSGTYELAPGWTGRAPVRATTQRGVTLGIEQRLPLEIAEGRFDLLYTTPFPGNAGGLGSGGAFLPGPRANLSVFRDLPGGTGVMSLGYRTDVGNPFRIGPVAPLSNTPVSRLPELSYFGMSRQAGPLRFSPSARLGYMLEEGGAASPLAELALSGGGPEFWLPAGIRVGTFGSLRANAYRELSAAERAAGDAFMGRLGRGVGQVGLSASADWLGLRLGGSAELVRVLTTTPANPYGTPFGHDAIASQDRVTGSARRHLFGPFSAGADLVLARPHEAARPPDWVQSDMGLNLSYEANCVSVHLNYKPLIQGWGFSYVVTSF